MSPKEKKYNDLLPAYENLMKGGVPLISNMANTTAFLKEYFNFFWVGFYLASNERLILGPFQGPVACTSIPYGKGVCGKAWESKNAIIVNDVRDYPGYIACHKEPLSEIVIPLFRSNHFIGVLDIDHTCVAFFDETDRNYLNQYMEIMIKHSNEK
jgi:GAF domain-containing protein